MTYSQEASPVSSDHEPISQIEHAIETVISECDTNAIFGTIPERVEYATKVAELKSEIETDERISSLDANNYIRTLEHGVAKRVGALANDLIKNDNVSDETLDALSALPVPASAFAPVIKSFYSKAVNAHEEVVKAATLAERNTRLQAAEPISMVAVTLARDIPEIKNADKRVVVAQSGEAIHAHHLKTVIHEAKTNNVKKQAVNSFLEMAYDHQIPDKSPLLKKIGVTAAAAAVTGIIISAAPAGAAHAHAKIEKIETKASPKEINDPKKVVVLPAAAPAPENSKPAETTVANPTEDAKTETPVPTPPTAAVAPKTEAPITSPEKQSFQLNQETESVESSPIKMKLPAQPTEMPKSTMKDDVKNTPAPAQANNEQVKDTNNTSLEETTGTVVENPTGNKSTNEQSSAPKDAESTKDTKTQDQPPSANEAKSDYIQMTLPDTEDITEPATDAPVSQPDDKHDDTITKVVDHLKEGPIKMKLPSVNKDEDIEKDTPKDDQPNVETIGQPEGHPDTKKDLNKEIGKVIMGNGPIKMSLKNVEQKTKERKDEDEIKGGFKPTFKFAPSAELPAEPKISAETYKGAPIPEVIVDPGLAGETAWTPEQLTIIRDNLDSYLAVAKRTGMPWELGVALHARETSLRFVNPANGQGLFQLYSSGAYFAPGPVSKENFETQLALGMNFIKKKGYELGYTDTQMTLEHPDVIKDILFSYNGRAWQYKDQAASLGFTNPAEGSPYVMNLADDKRNNLKNPSWGQILRDNDKNLGPANQVPGAWVLIEGMMHIEKKAHDQAVAKQEAEAQAFAAQKAAEAKAAADAEAAKNAQTIGNKEVEPFNGWHRPVPANSAVSPQYPGHKGIDFAVKSGTPFYAASGGVAKVIIYDDVRDDEFCIAAFDKLGRKTSEIKDPVQKEVRITRMIGNDEYVLIYAHMSQIDVKDGDIVTAGQEIGKTGNSGCSTGDHAHFEVRKNGVAIDPNLVLNGAINVSSSEIEPADDEHVHDDHEHETETVSQGVGAAGPSDEQKRHLEAMKRVEEIQQLAAAMNGQEGYISLR